MYVDALPEALKLWETRRLQAGLSDSVRQRVEKLVRELDQVLAEVEPKPEPVTLYGRPVLGLFTAA